MLDPALGWLITLGTAVLLASAAGRKMQRDSDFAEAAAAYRVVPEGVARHLAPAVPCLELALAAGLVWPASRRAALAGALGLMLVYALLIALNLARGRRDLDCGCTLGARRSIAPWMVGRNLCLASLLGAALLPWASRPWSGADLATVAGGLAAAAALYAALDRLLGEVAPRGRALGARSAA